jgi:hypothetical protein
MYVITNITAVKEILIDKSALVFFFGFYLDAEFFWVFLDAGV